VYTAVDLDKPSLNLTHRWVRQGDWKLIWFEEKKAGELYHVAQDPFEEKDQAKDQGEKVKQLTEVLNRWWQGR
jgi:uncharacterized sulfatase